MTASARAKPKTSILRTAAGEPPLGPEGLSFRADQGEMFEPETASYRSMATRIGVLELNTGKWLSFPFGIDRTHHATREEALRHGISGMIRKARRYMRAKEGEGTRWTEGFAGRVIEWALSLKPDIGIPISEEINPQPNPNSVLGTKPPLEEITDPIVKELCEAHRARKEYPAGHTFAMTNPIINGQMVTMGTCTCGDSFSYACGSYERMDAAIEAHWQKFDHLPGKVDGQGNPIESSAGAADNPTRDNMVGPAGLLSSGEIPGPGTKKPKRKKKSNIADASQQPRSEPASNPTVPAPHGSDDAGSPLHSPEAGGHAEPQGPAPETDATNAGAGEIQGAQICAGDAKCVGCVLLPWIAYPDSPLLQAALALAWCEEVALPDPVKQFEAALPALMGPEEKRRKLTEFKLALKQRPVNLGPLFGIVPPPSNVAT